MSSECRFMSMLCQLIHPSRNLKLFSSEHKETLDKVSAAFPAELL